MKFTKYALMAAGCALLASCSSEEPIVENGATNGTNTAGNASGYASFNINLPTSRAGFGRAVTYDEGTAQEYAVTNGKVLVFQNAATEADAKFICMDELAGMNWGAGVAGEITTTSTSIAQLHDIKLADASYQYSAVIVLNYDPETFIFPTADQTFGDWSKTVQSKMTVTASGKDFITMSNAPEVKAGATIPVTLVPIDKTKIAATAAGVNGSAADIYVQRAVSKVTVIANGPIDLPEQSTYKGDKVEITAWALDITNKSSYPVQVTTGLDADYASIWNTADDKNRFIGTSTVFRRAYWAIDPNYNKDITTVAQTKHYFDVVTEADVNSKPEVAYCLENTFDIAHMKQGQTTRVVFKGKYTPNIEGYTAGASFFKMGNNTQLWLENSLKEEIIGKTMTVVKKAKETISVDLSRVISNAGNYSLNDITIKVNDNDVTADQKTAIAQALGLLSAADNSIANYKEGTVYYIARIKHFGDEETPWQIGQPTYDGDNAKWLGRYGMVRNTAYEMKVTKVTNPGSPVIPEIKPDTPDDEDTYFIQVSINVLSWAKRTNNVEL